MAQPKGFFLAPNIYVDEFGGLYRDTDQSGLGANWEKIGQYFAPFVAAGAGWIAAKGNKNQPPYQEGYPQAPGAYAGATSQGLFGGIDTTTLLLIGGAALLFFSMPAGKR
jgi:hypothetical protein